MESVVRELLELINDYAVIITKRERKTEETRRHMGLKWEEFVRVEEEEVRDEESVRVGEVREEESVKVEEEEVRQEESVRVEGEEARDEESVMAKGEEV